MDKPKKGENIMKNYIKPEITYVDFATEEITGAQAGGGVGNSSTPITD